MLALLLQRRLIIVILLVVIIVSGLLFFLFGRGGSGNEKVTLTYWGLWETKELMQPFIDKFQQENPNVTINYEQKSLTGYRQSLIERIKAGTGPDIFQIHNTWLPELPTSNLNTSLLSPVPPNIYTSDQIEKDFYPTVTESFSAPLVDKNNKPIGRQYYALPAHYDGLALVYNDNLVSGKQAQLDAANIDWPPKTWEEFNRAAQILTDKDTSGNINISGAALGTASNVDNFSDIVGLLLLQSQVQLLDKKQVKLHNTVGRTDGRNVGADALRFYTDFATGNNKTWDDNLPGSTQAFADGKVATILVPSWRLLEINEMQKASGVKFNFKTAAVPQLAGNPTVTWASYWANAVSVKAKSKDAAWKFVKYLSENETMKNMYAAQVKTRPYGQLYARRDLASTLKEDALLFPFLEQAPTGRSWYLASRTKDGTAGLNDKNSEYLANAINTIRKQSGDADSAIKTFAQGVSQVLNSFGLADPLQL